MLGACELVLYYARQLGFSEGVFEDSDRLSFVEEILMRLDWVSVRGIEEVPKALFPASSKAHMWISLCPGMVPFMRSPAANL